MIDLLFKYQSLLKISLSHDYYNEGYTDQFKLVPVPSTNQALEKTGFLVRNDKAGINILADLDRPEKTLFYLNNEEPMKLHFWLFTNNPYFINVTDYPIEAGDNILYLTNKGKKHTPEKTISLHEGEFAGGNDLYPVSNDPVNTFGFDKEEEYDVKNGATDNLVMNGISGTDVSLQLSASAAMAGRYTIYGGKEEKSFIYPGSNLSLRPLGLIEIVIDGEMKDQLIAGITEDEQIPSFHFTINFHRRATYWKYLVVPRYSNGIKQTVIYSEEKEASFTGPEETKMHNGATAWVFKSSKPLELFELPSYHFQLKRAGNNGSGKILIGRLPTPGIEMIKPESRKADSKVYSEIIVFI